MKFRFGIIAVISLLLSSCGGVSTEQTYDGYVWPSLREPKISLAQIIDYEYVKNRRSMLEKFIGYEFDIRPLHRPYAVAANDTTLAFSDIRYGVVHLMQRQTGELTTLTHLGNERLFSPVDLEMDGDRLYIVDSKLGKVFRYGLVTGFVDEMQVAASRPTAVAVDGGNNLLVVTDTTEHTVIVQSLLGKELFRITDNLNFPIDAAVVPEKREIYVLDAMNFRIMVYDYEGTLRRQFGSIGKNPGQFSKPKSITVDKYGRVYVSDADFDNFQIFNENGELLYFIGSRGNTPERFWMPARMYAYNNNLFISDIFNERIKVFTLYP